ncbi:MAG: hypothetical protein M3464_11215 [Chloroflexota bacterium]|nr:hypothetical protein [Chloroflexota bacterium]
MLDEPEPTAAVHPGRAPGFVWKDFSRFVEVHAVKTGWLVLWGHYADAGNRKLLAGNQTYADLPSARRRLIDAVLELTGKQHLAAEALALLDRAPLPANHESRLPPEPL